MRWRVVVAVVLALAVGVGGGWALASAQDEPTSAPAPVALSIAPVPADPALPIPVAQPDPDDPTLEPGVDTEDETLSYPDADNPTYQVYLPVPVGWERSYNGEFRWYFTKPGNDPKSYALRVDLLAEQGRSVESAVAARTAALRSSELQGNSTDLRIEPFSTDDGFTATYTDAEGYRRVSTEQFYAGSDGTAFVTVAVVGRVRDQRGLEDLAARITTGLSFSTF